MGPGLGAWSLARWRGSVPGCTRHPSRPMWRRRAMKLRAKAVIVITVDRDRYGITSYGMTRKLCDAARQVTNDIDEAINTGDIEIPEELTL